MLLQFNYEWLLMKKNVLLILSCMVLMLSSCSKRYDFDNVNGVAMDGEILAPLATASYTLEGLMERFEIDTMMSFDADGGMHFVLNYDFEDAVDGENILYFNDIDVNEEFSIPNPYPFVLPEPIDTTLVFTQTVNLKSDYIAVLMAEIRSGRFDFEISSNVLGINKLIVRSSEIKDADGNEMCLIYNPSAGQNGFDLEGLRYETEVENTVNLTYEVSLTLQNLTAPELHFGAMLHITNMRVREMMGRVTDYSSRNRFDTTFNLFPNKIEGVAGICDARVKLQERNGFEMAAKLCIDTALVSGEGVLPCDIFAQMPVAIDIPKSAGFNEVFSQNVRGNLNMVSNRVCASGLFALNPEGLSENVYVSDTSTIDVKVEADIPCAFNVNNVSYFDTVNMRLSEITYPEMIQEINLDLEFLTDLPFNFDVNVFMYDSQNQVITDTLASNARIQGSFDGTMKASQLVVKVTEDRVNKVLNSDRIILDFSLDTDARDVVLNLKQCLDFALKAAVKYNGNVEFSKN